MVREIIVNTGPVQPLSADERRGLEEIAAQVSQALDDGDYETASRMRRQAIAAVEVGALGLPDSVDIIIPVVPDSSVVRRRR